MRFKEPHYLGAADANSRKRRLETVLAAWRVPRFEYWARPGTPPPGTELEGDDLRLWSEILRAAEPVPPRTHRAGFDIYARLFDLKLEELERDEAVRIIGDRVALSGKVTGLPLRFYDWSLLIPVRIGEHETEAVLNRRFQDVQAFGDQWLVAGSWFNCTDSICLLVQEALTATPKALMRLWQVSLGLHLEYRFLPALPARPAEQLATRLGEELLAARDRLGVETDAELLRFALGRNDGGPRVQPLLLPESRFGQLLEIGRFFERTRYRPGGAYYDAAASALARIAGNPYVVGNVLLELAPGSALVSALESIALDRPELLATYLFHQSFHAEGAFLLTQLAQRAQLPQADQIELGEEWLQVQRLGRELMLLNERAIDWDSLIALGVQDESQALSRQHYGVAPIDRDKAPYDGEALWNEAVSEPARAEHFTEALERHLRSPGPHPDASFLFALRLIAPLRDTDRALATRLATAIVDAYAASLSLDAGVRMIPTLLPAYGALLAELPKVLDVHGKVWRRFLRPFDADAHLARALADQANTATTTNSASFTVPQILRAHAETLIALASAMGTGFEEPLNEALALHKDDCAATGLHITAFTWNALARIAFVGRRPPGEPLFLSIGRLFARVEGEPPWLEDYLRDEQQAHILGWILAGLGAEHPLTQKYRPHLRALLDALVGTDHGIALGHAIELSNILEHAAMPAESEHFARYALKILEGFERGGPDHFSLLAQALLAVSLARQEKWPDVFRLEPDRNALVVSPQARVVENMRAFALLNTGKVQEARDALARVLKLEPANSTALANSVAANLRAEDWPGAIEAAERAKRVVSGEERDGVLLYEAHAREKLGDTYGAAAVLAGLSEKTARRDDVVAVRERLLGGSRSIVPVRATVVRDVALDAPDESVDIAIVTALPVEYEAMRKQLKAQQDPEPGEGRRANFNAWLLGKIPKANGPGTYRVVLAVARRSGNLDTYRAARRTIERWNPRVLIFSGVAGGLRRDELRQGDVVVSEHIWHYDHGKILEGGGHEPRNRDYPVHSGLVTSARSFSNRTDAWKNCGVDAPLPNHVPQCLVGLIGSGDKVLEDLRPRFSRAIRKARPELQAVEMEAAGAGAAIEEAHEERNPVAFVMIRGISDMPRDGKAAQGAGTSERDNWKPYASAIAANFIVSWVASTTFPFAPMELASDGQPDLLAVKPPGKR